MPCNSSWLWKGEASRAVGVLAVACSHQKCSSICAVHKRVGVAVTSCCVAKWGGEGTSSCFGIYALGGGSCPPAMAHRLTASQAWFLGYAFLVCEIPGYAKARSFLVSHAECEICNDKLCISWEEMMKHELFFSSSSCRFLSCTLGFIIRAASFTWFPEGRMDYYFSFPASFLLHIFWLHCQEGAPMCFFFCLQSSFVIVTSVCHMKLAFLVAQ